MDGVGDVVEPRKRKRIEDIRVPAVKGLSDDLYRILHGSLVDLLRLRRSIESTDVALRSSAQAIAESRELLRRTRS